MSWAAAALPDYLKPNRRLGDFLYLSQALGHGFTKREKERENNLPSNVHAAQHEADYSILPTAKILRVVLYVTSYTCVKLDGAFHVLPHQLYGEHSSVVMTLEREKTIEMEKQQKWALTEYNLLLHMRQKASHAGVDLHDEKKRRKKKKKKKKKTWCHGPLTGQASFLRSLDIFRFPLWVE